MHPRIQGPALSWTAVAVAEAAERMEVPVITPSAASSRVTGGNRFSFRAVARDRFAGEAVSRFLVEDLGLRRIGVLYNAADPYSADITQVSSEQVTTLGAVVAASEPFTVDNVAHGFGAHLQRIVDSGAYPG